MPTWTQADVDALKAAIATGVLEVEYDGPPKRRVRYHGLAEMRALLASMQQDVAAAAGTTTNYRFGSSRKGF